MNRKHRTGRFADQEFWEDVLEATNHLPSESGRQARRLVAELRLLLSGLDTGQSKSHLRTGASVSRTGAPDVSMGRHHHASKRKSAHKSDGAEGAPGRSRSTEGIVGRRDMGEHALVGEGLSRYEGIRDTVGKPVERHDPQSGDLVSAQEIAKQLKLKTSAVTKGIEENRVLGYPGVKCDWLVPKAQFKDSKVVPGIAEMIAMFDNRHRETWFFLASDLFYGSANPRPIDRLRALEHNDREGLDACLECLEFVKRGHDQGAHF